MISFLPEDRQSALEKCCAVLAEKTALVTFVEPGPAHPAGESRLASAAASIAVEAECRHAGGLGLMLFPVHLFLPVGRTHARELLIDIDQPETAQDYISRAGGTPHDQVKNLPSLWKEDVRRTPSGSSPRIWRNSWATWNRHYAMTFRKNSRRTRHGNRSRMGLN